MPTPNFGQDLWEKMKAWVKQPDGLETYQCLEHTRDKLFVIAKYLAQFTHQMHDNRMFPAGINYVDLFSSYGVCTDKYDSSRRFPGSALLAAGCNKPFHRMFLVDKDAEKCSSVRTRIDNLGTATQLTVFEGDSNAEVEKIAVAIPANSLTVAVIDPYALTTLSFDALRRLTNNKQMDVLMLFADRYDLVRNIDEYYVRDNSSKLDDFLGTSDWRADYEELLNRSSANIIELFIHRYVNQLKSIGYYYSDHLPIPRTNPLYRLVFASKNELGLKCWRIATDEDRQGNRGLFPTI